MNREASAPTTSRRAPHSSRPRASPRFPICHRRSVASAQSAERLADCAAEAPPSIGEAQPAIDAGEQRLPELPLRRSSSRG